MNRQARLQGWTGLEKWPGFPQGMFQQEPILTGQPTGKVLKYWLQDQSAGGPLQEPRADFGHAGTSKSSPWLLPGLSNLLLAIQFSQQGGAGGGNMLRPYSKHMPMRTNLSRCLACPTVAKTRAHADF